MIFLFESDKPVCQYFLGFCISNEGVFDFSSNNTKLFKAENNMSHNIYVYIYEAYYRCKTQNWLEEIYFFL